MAFGMVVQIPVTGAFGTDEEFDLRTRLERELDAALTAERSGECGRGEIEGGRMLVRLEAIAEPTTAFRIVKEVLTRLKLLHRATVVLEGRCASDPDEIDRQVLWRGQQSAASRVA